MHAPNHLVCEGAGPPGYQSPMTAITGSGRVYRYTWSWFHHGQTLTDKLESKLLTTEHYHYAYPYKIMQSVLDMPTIYHRTHLHVRTRVRVRVWDALAMIMFCC